LLAHYYVYGVIIIMSLGLFPRSTLEDSLPAAAAAAAASSSAAAAASPFLLAVGPIVRGILAPGGVITQLHLLSLGWTPQPHHSDEEGEEDIINRADDAAEGGKGTRKKNLMNKEECKRIIREYNESRPSKSQKRVLLSGNIDELRARVAAIRAADDDEDEDEDEGGGGGGGAGAKHVGFSEHTGDEEGVDAERGPSIMSVDHPVQPPPPR
jgi:hypothetical protein